MTLPDTPETRAFLESALKTFSAGHWHLLGITGEQENALHAQLTSYDLAGKTPPARLLYQTKRVWDAHRDRILQAWLGETEALEAAEDADGIDPLYPEPCESCPNCDCPGME